ELARDLSRDLWPKNYDQKRTEADGDRVWVERRGVFRIFYPFIDKIRGNAFDLQAEKIPYLGRKNYQSDSGRKTDRNRIGDELEERPHSGNAHYDQYNTGDECCDDQSVVAVLLDDAVNN